MGIESNKFGEYVPRESELLVGNSIQGALIMKEALGKEDTNSVAEDWINRYAAYFHEVFDKYKIDHPTVIEDWNDMSKREDIISDFEQLLEEMSIEQGHSKAA
jgi:hypothetical protein